MFLREICWGYPTRASQIARSGALGRDVRFGMRGAHSGGLQGAGGEGGAHPGVERGAPPGGARGALVQFEALMRTQEIDAETASLLHLAVRAFVGVLALVLWEEGDAVH